MSEVRVEAAGNIALFWGRTIREQTPISCLAGQRMEERTCRLRGMYPSSTG